MEEKKRKEKEKEVGMKRIVRRGIKKIIVGIIDVL